MANGMLEAQVIGNIVRDPEKKEWSGTSYATFAIAVNNYVRDRKDVTYLDCALWGKPAESFMKYAHKGQTIYLTGSLRLKSYEYKGEQRQKLTLTVKDYRVLIKNSEYDENPTSGGLSETQEKPLSNSAKETSDFESEEQMDENIPF